MERSKPGHRERFPTTVVVCGGLEQASHVERRPGVPVTWIADRSALERIESVALPAVAAGRTAADAVAIVIEPAWLESRQALQDAVEAGRRVHADLVTGAVRDVAVHDPRLAAAAGLRAVLVRSFAAGRNARRPAPAGWPCRNPAWGLWEVKATESPPRTGIWGRLLGLRSGSAAGRGGLVVLDASTAAVGVLQRWLDWAARGVTAGTAVTSTLPELASILESTRGLPAASAAAGEDRGSVLKAA